MRDNAGPPGGAEPDGPEPDARLIELAGAVADGSPIEVNDPRGSKPTVAGDALRDLRVIAGIAAVHRREAPAAKIAAGAPAVRGAHAPDLRRAVRWGPLMLLEKIGGGSFGEVHRAWDPSIEHEVALKLLRAPAQARAAISPSSVIREGQMLARVRHPNVVVVHGAAEVEGQIGIWTEFLHGRTLERVVADEGAMSAEEATLVGDSVCRAAAAVHKCGLLHRDIKASNVMREAGGRIVLLDFGTGIELTLASLPAGISGSARLAGTPLYMAPELFDGSPASVQSDVYSIGVLLFFLVTGTHPITGRSLTDVRAAHQTGRRVLLSDARPDLPRRFVAVVERALSPEPEARYQSAGAMLRDLTDRETGAVSAGPRERQGLSAGTIAAIGAGGLATLVLVVALLGYVTSTAYNAHLGIGGAFLSEGPADYIIWGIRSLIPPLFYIGVAMFLIYAAGAIVDLGAAIMPALKRPVERGRAWWRAALHRANLDDADTHAKVMCAVGATGLVAISAAFWRVIAGFTSQVDSSPMETLAILHPDNLNTHVLFGVSLYMLLLVLLFGLGRVVRGRRGGARPSPGPVIGMLALAALILLLHEGAWRILYQNYFRQATFGDRTCYVLAQNGAEYLLNCPQSPPPRNRVVAGSDPQLQLTGTVQQISSAFTTDTGRAPR